MLSYCDNLEPHHLMMAKTIDFFRLCCDLVSMLRMLSFTYPGTFMLYARKPNNQKTAG